MTDELVVLLDDAVAGTLSRDDKGQIHFEYDDEYRSRINPTPLSLSMPPAIKTRPDSVVVPWLWGLLPENPKVLELWARKFHVSASSPFGLLGSPVGQDCAGAVRFCHPEAIDTVLNASGGVTWLTDKQVGERLYDLRTDASAWLGRSFDGRFSLAGAQAKIALTRTDGQWGIPYGSTPTTHILKPAVVGLEDHDINEHLCLDAARRAGLNAARTTIQNIGAQSAVVVERYDRQTIDGQIRRIHQEDLCQALGVFPSKKYQNEGGPSPTRVCEILRRTVEASYADQAVWNFADALIWNWLIAGTDAHAKNYSVLLQRRSIRLAPMYDVASALPYGEHEKKLHFAMKIGGDYGVYPSRNNWKTVAGEISVSPDRLIDRVLEIGTVVADSFADAVAETQIRVLDSALPVKLLDLVANRANRCMRLIDPTVVVRSPVQRPPLGEI